MTCFYAHAKKWPKGIIEFALFIYVCVSESCPGHNLAIHDVI